MEISFFGNLYFFSLTFSLIRSRLTTSTSAYVFAPTICHAICFPSTTSRSSVRPPRQSHRDDNGCLRCHGAQLRPATADSSACSFIHVKQRLCSHLHVPIVPAASSATDGHFSDHTNYAARNASDRRQRHHSAATAGGHSVQPSASATAAAAASVLPGTTPALETGTTCCVSHPSIQTQRRRSWPDCAK